MGALTDLWNSERGIVAVVLIVASTILTGIDRMTIAQWTAFVTTIYIAYAAAKTITGGISIAKGAPESTQPGAVAPAPSSVVTP